MHASTCVRHVHQASPGHGETSRAASARHRQRSDAGQACKAAEPSGPWRCGGQVRPWCLVRRRGAHGHGLDDVAAGTPSPGRSRPLECPGQRPRAGVMGMGKTDPLRRRQAGVVHPCRPPGPVPVSILIVRRQLQIGPSSSAGADASSKHPWQSVVKMTDLALRYCFGIPSGAVPGAVLDRCGLGEGPVPVLAGSGGGIIGPHRPACETAPRRFHERCPPVRPRRWTGSPGTRRRRCC